jgi:hypothetical protein
MGYKFVKTVQGPAIQGDDEILFDYHDEHPLFLEEAKKFLSDGLKAIAGDIADGMFFPVVGGDQTRALYGYMDAIRSIGEFEFRFLPSIPQQNNQQPQI